MPFWIRAFLTTDKLIPAQTTTPPAAADQTVPGEAPGKSHSLWQEALQRLVRDRAALTGGIIIILLFLTALLADLIAPYYFEKQSRTG